MNKFQIIAAVIEDAIKRIKGSENTCICHTDLGFGVIAKIFGALDKAEITLIYNRYFDQQLKVKKLQPKKFVSVEELEKHKKEKLSQIVDPQAAFIGAFDCFVLTYMIDALRSIKDSN